MENNEIVTDADYNEGVSHGYASGKADAGFTMGMTALLFIPTLIFALVLTYLTLDYREKQHDRGERYYRFFYENILPLNTKIIAQGLKEDAVTITLSEGSNGIVWTCATCSTITSLGSNKPLGAIR